MGAFGATANDGGDVEFFYAMSEGLGTLTHVYRDVDSTNWVSEAVQLPTGEVQPFISYSSDVAIGDPSGAPLPNTAVVVSANEQAEVVIGGAVYRLDPATPVTVSTNAAGILSVAQQTSTLGVPVLQLVVPSVMQEGQSIVLDQAAGTQETFGTVTGPQLMAAQLPNGNYLIPEQYRTTTQTNALAQAFNACMDVDATPPNGIQMQLRRGASRGVWLCTNTPAASLGRIRPRNPRHWRLSFEGGQIRYETLTAEQAAALVAAKRAALGSGGLMSWFGTIGDFLAGVVEDAIDIVDTVVTTVADAIEVTFTFVAEQVTYAFNATVALIEEAFDVVEAFFAQVDVAFEQVFEWIGFVFDWDDILRTKQAIAYTLEQFLQFLPPAMGGIQKFVDQGIGNLKGQVGTLFEWAIQNVAGQSTIGGFVQANDKPSPVFEASAANNIIYNGVLDNAASATAPAISLSQTAQNALQAFFQQVEPFVDGLQKLPGFQNALQYFTTLSGSADQMFQQSLAGLLSLAQGIVEAVLSGIQAIADALLQLLQTLVPALQQMLTEQWQIPFVTPFYAWLTNGSPLTIVDLAALICAVPTTVCYKVLYGAAPFPTAADVTAFEAVFNAQTLLAASGLGDGGEQDLQRSTDGVTGGGGILPPAMADFVLIGSLFAGLFYGGLSAAGDADTDDQLPLVPALTFLAGLAGQACTLPWWTMSGPPSCSGPNTLMTVWLAQLVGLALPAPFLFVYEAQWVKGTPGRAAMIRVAETWLTCVYGVLGQLGPAIVAAVAWWSRSAGIVAAKFAYCIPSICKPLRLVKHPAAIPTLVAIDFFCYAGSIIGSAFATFPPGKG